MKNHKLEQYLFISRLTLLSLEFLFTFLKATNYDLRTAWTVVQGEGPTFSGDKFVVYKNGTILQIIDCISHLTTNILIFGAVKL